MYVLPSLLFLIITFLPPKLDEIGMKNGPVVWVDVGGTGVGVGSTGAISWSIKVNLHWFILYIYICVCVCFFVS